MYRARLTGGKWINCPTYEDLLHSHEQWGVLESYSLKEIKRDLNRAANGQEPLTDYLKPLWNECSM